MQRHSSSLNVFYPVLTARQQNRFMKVTAGGRDQVLRPGQGSACDCQVTEENLSRGSRFVISVRKEEKQKPVEQGLPKEQECEVRAAGGWGVGEGRAFSNGRMKARVRVRTGREAGDRSGVLGNAPPAPWTGAEGPDPGRVRTVTAAERQRDLSKGTVAVAPPEAGMKAACEAKQDVKVTVGGGKESQ